MTFYGESLPLDWANDLVGNGAGNAGDELRYHFDDTATVVAAGDEFIAGAFMWSGGVSGLTASDEVSLAWVLEVGPSTAGTLTLASGVDPTGGLDNPALATEALGTHALSGASTLVLPTTVQDATQLLAADDEAILYVQGVSGAVELLQVKLRVWPPGGPLGAWVPADGYSIERTAMALGQVVGAVGEVPRGDNFGDAQSAHDDAQVRARANLTASIGGVRSYSMNALADASMFSEPVPQEFGTWEAQAQFTEGNLYLLAEPTDYPSLDVGVGGFDPHEVPEEQYGAYVRAPGGGDPGPATFAEWTGSLTAGATRANTTDSQWVTFHDLPAKPAMTETSSSTFDIAWQTYAAGGGAVIPADGVDHAVTLPALGPFVVVTPQTAGRVGAPAVGTVADTILQTVGIHSVTPTYRAWVAPFEYYDPTASPRQPRFFVKDHEEVWRPVGFGKPASDLSLFHVWTPVGWYVECRDGEAYTNAHPLKVKLYDGSWDTVAHMRPV